MSFVTPGFAIFMFSLILIISGIAAWLYGSYNNYDIATFHTFIAVLTGLGVFVTFMFYFSVVELQQQQQQLFIIDETSRISKNVLNSILGEINTATKLIPQFCASITPLSHSPVLDPDIVTTESCSQKLVLSYKIFSVWQDLIISARFINFDPISYVTNFLQRANSKLLFAQWTTSKINFNILTQQLGDLLFEYALPITNQTPETYVQAAQNLIIDNRFTSIINK